MIPSTLVRLKNVASINDDQLDENTSPDHVFEYVDVGAVGRGLLVDEPEKMRFEDAPSRARRLVRVGDTIVSTVRTYLRAILPITPDMDDVVVSTGFAVVRPRPTVDRRFLSWALQADPFVEEVVARSVGVSYPAIAPSAMADIKLTVPIAQRDQRLIADFLDQETQRIDALVDAKRRMLDLLEEKWSSLVTHMTSPEPLPQDWEEGPLSRWWTVIDCKHRTATYVDDGIPIVGTPDVRNGRLRLEGARRTTREDYLDLTQGQRKPSRGDIIYSRNASLGQAAYVDTDAEFCMGQDVCLITSKDNDQLFLAYQLSNSRVNQQVDQLVVGATFKRINVAEIRKLIVVRPPIHQQTEIAEELDSRQRSIRAVTKRLDRQISLLAEYRQALITQAVTGQLDETTLKGEKPADEVVGV